ncbi:Rieske (2Fe-2S) protein [Paenibacillus apiarius]|uniref:Rieske (2Fe-2S) protein n=1 Tax=Paenibacillus apiarius TaxID=46240 RepID=UPI00300DAA14
MTNWVHAGALEELKEEGAKVIKGGIAVFYHEEKVYAVDNRCPHMGFPLHMGSLCDGILTCHWHHARFDVCSGGTLDPWADDVSTYPVKLEAGEIYVNPKQASKGDAERHFQRLHEGLEQNLSLVIAKSVVALVEAGVPDVQIARVGLEYGTTYRSGGWGSGLTILAAMVNILPKLDHYNRILALYHGLTRVAADCSGRPPKFLMQALPNDDVSIDRLTTWYRQCIEVHDTQGAERESTASIPKMILETGSRFCIRLHMPMPCMKACFAAPTILRFAQYTMQESVYISTASSTFQPHHRRHPRSTAAMATRPI